MLGKLISSMEYATLQKKLKQITKNRSFHAPEVVEISQKLDRYIVQAMKN